MEEYVKGRENHLHGAARCDSEEIRDFSDEGDVYEEREASK